MTLTATDSTARPPDSLLATVNNVAPTASLFGPTTGAAENVLTFTASATDPGSLDTAAGFAYNWNFGDGTTATGATASHIYSAAGTYTVSVTATDKDGGVSTAAKQAVTIKASTPYGGKAWAIPGQIQAENYDAGGQNVAYYDTTTGNAGKVYRTDDVDLQACSAGGYDVYNSAPASGSTTRSTSPRRAPTSSASASPRSSRGACST